MQIHELILMPIISVIVLFISTKIIGNKQMSELNMFDYINGITIGSIGAELAIGDFGELYMPLTAIAIYTVVIWIVSLISEKSVGARRFFSGRSIFLMENGKIYNKNFKTAKVDMNEFLTQCRISGYFNLDDIDTAILEQNGKISFLPKTAARPVNTKDMGLVIAQESAAVNVILDGNILDKNLQKTGNNITWLEKELKKQKIGNIKDVFLAFCTDDNTLSVYTKSDEHPLNDIFE